MAQDNTGSAAAGPPDPDPSNPEFQAVLKALVDIYRPILEGPGRGIRQSRTRL